MTAPALLPVNLLTGFLGSGKTTLLRRLLSDPALSGAAVLINEFGEVGLDHHLVERIDETMVLLQSGCVCCTIRGELSEALRDLLSKRARGLVPAFDRLVIESTGLADPFPILSTLRADPVLSHHLAPGSIVATVDAFNAADQIARRPEMTKQISAADRIVVTKGDLVTPEALDALVHRLAALNPAAAVVDVHGAAWDAAWLMADATGLAPTQEPEGDHSHSHPDGHHGHHRHDPNRHGETIRSFSVTLDRPIDWTGFGIWLSMLLNRHGHRILRVKGILDLAGEARPVAVHGVQHLVHPPTHMAAWSDGPRTSRLVFIVDGIEEARIRASFEVFAGLR
ncbi:GTP-binding protein [Methylobacterium sp. AMS5]|uniref:CobW family GTP-binding protein n=1 Tax=Methylobacterium sp. AMS5 TaxID=925818 RepID=UPI00074F9F8D|nr:GTP-binding protein [Methylobacterium sp. AMS5]AMB45267.1 cobalamin biosynthesis protein CobW [Methylobacterium sp. AMS5]